MAIRAIVPSAGKGSRLGTTEADAPKVMRLCSGKPLLETVLSQLGFCESVTVVVGYKKEQVMAYFGDQVSYVEQKEQLGTGHAVLVCADAFRDFDGTVLVTFGDMPLFRRESMEALCRFHEESGAACTLMTAENPELTMWARIVRDGAGDFAAIVEGKDCTPEQAEIKELFAGVIAFDSRKLFEILPEVKTNNVQHEYYLTEVPELMRARGLKVETFMTDDGEDLFGVNTPEDLIRCESIMKKRAEKH